MVEEKKKKPEYKPGFYELKLKLPHPHNQMRLQDHLVTNATNTFELNEKECKELASQGCQHWFEIKKVPKPADVPTVA